MNGPGEEWGPGRKPPWVIGHRGAAAEYPENTLSSLRAAAHCAGVQAVECDIQLSREGTPVVIHDPDLRRIAGRRERVADLTGADLGRIDAGAWFGAAFAGEPVPRLDEVLAALPGARLWLELKVYPGDRPDRLVQAVARCIAVHRADRRLRILSFHDAVLDAFRRETPGVPRMRLLRKAPTDPAAWDEAADGVDAIDIDVRLLTEDLVREAHARGRAVAVYTCNAPREAAWACRCGADAITTDRPAWLAAEVAAGRWNV